jgi:hypothetical protein
MEYINGAEPGTMQQWNSIAQHHFLTLFVSVYPLSRIFQEADDTCEIP